MNIGLKSTLISISVLSALPLSAQFSSNYFDASLGGGVHPILYNPADNGVTRSAGLGGAVNLGYRHFFTDNFGVGTGFGVRFYNTYGKCNFVEKTDMFDALGREKIGTLVTNYSQWAEKQKFARFEIHLGAYYQREIGYMITFQAGAGALLGFPISARYKITEGSYKQTQEYISDIETVPVAKTYSVEDGEIADKYDKKNFSAGFFIDLGIHKWTKKGVGVYAGVYIDYTASDVLNCYTKPITSINGYEGILASNQITDVNLLSVGLKMGVALPMQKKKRKEDLPDNAPLVAEEPMINVRDSITHLPDSLIYVRYSREEVAKVKRLIANMPEVEAIDESKKRTYKSVLEAYDTLTSFEKLDITWFERGKLKKADYALNGEERLKELCEVMNQEIQFGYMQSGFTSTKTLESAFDDLTFLMKLLPDATLFVEGRTDDKEVQNDPALGKERALFIREILMKKGVAGDQLEIENLSDKKPVAPLTSEDGRAKNRTVTFRCKF